MTMMNNDTNSFSKGQLAKLLSTENISFRHDPSVQTAYFDIKHRELVLPVWRNISEDLYDMLVVHEVGHALDTPADGWLSAIKTIAKKIHGDAVSPRIESAIKGFLNVIEDARIDKRQKRRYPGSKRNYVIGYKELIQRDFFGTQSRSLDSYSFIDRANIYFKGGALMGIKFTSEERKFIKRMEDAETFDEVVTLTEDIYAWSKAKGQSTVVTGVGMVEDEEGEEGFDEAFDSSGLNDTDEDEGNAGGDADGEGEEDESGDEKPAGSSSADQDEDEQDEQETGAAPSDGAGSSDDDFIPDVETEREYQRNVGTIISNNDINYIYLDIPVAILDRIVVDYKKVMAEQNAVFMSHTAEWRAALIQKVQTFKNQERRTISYMVKEFEQKKAAELYAKTAIAKTGVINTNKLHSYLYNEDIFRRVTTVPQGKNHGFVMFLDWSGSMYANMDATIKQLISLTMFCKQVQIPFEVYLFRDLRGSEYRDDWYSKNRYEQFKMAKNCLDTGTPFVLRNILSSRMNAAELSHAYVMLMSYRVATRMVDPMNGTPLNAAIIAAEQIVNDFRKKNRLEIVNTVFLTDGDSNYCSAPFVDRNQYPYRSKGDRYILRDNKSKKEYMLGSSVVSSSDEITNILLSILRDRTGSNTVGFFLTQSTFNTIYARYLSNDKNVDRQKVLTYWKDNNFLPVKSQGYDEYFVVNSRGMDIANNTLKIDANMTKGKIAKEFMKFSESKTINRVLLRQFVEVIAKHKSQTA